MCVLVLNIHIKILHNANLLLIFHMFGQQYQLACPFSEKLFTFASFFPLETGALVDAFFSALHPDPPSNSPRPLGPVQ